MIKIEFSVQSSDVSFSARFASTTKIAVLYSFVRRKLPNIPSDREFELVFENQVLNQQLTCNQCHMSDQATLTVRMVDNQIQINVQREMKEIAQNPAEWNAVFPHRRFKLIWRRRVRFHPSLAQIVEDSERLRQLVLASPVKQIPEMYITMASAVAAHDDAIWEAAKLEPNMFSNQIMPLLEDPDIRESVMTVFMTEETIDEIEDLLSSALQTQHRFVEFLNGELNQQKFMAIFEDDFLLKQAVINPERVRLAIVGLLATHHCNVITAMSLEAYLCWLDRELAAEFAALPATQMCAAAQWMTPDEFLGHVFRDTYPDPGVQLRVGQQIGGALDDAGRFRTLVETDQGRLNGLFEGSFLTRRLANEPERLRGLVVQYLGMQTRAAKKAAEDVVIIIDLTEVGVEYGEDRALQTLLDMDLGLPTETLIEMLEQNQWSVEKVLEKLGMI